MESLSLREEKTVGPTLKVSEEIQASKHRLEGENFSEAMNRIAAPLADNSTHYHAFRKILHAMRFLPAGRIQISVGSPRAITPFNCFVSGTLNDNFVTGIGGNDFFKEGGIMARAAEAAQTMRMGGGIGYDFTTLRPRGTLIKSLDSGASGPISFMNIYNEVCLTTMSAGHRRGAQMAVLRVDHPDIEEYLHAKQNTTALLGFNTSIAVTDEFMHAVINDTDFELRWGGRVYKRINARSLWELIMRSTWDWAEPGVLFIDRINEMNNLYYCEDITATNPCGEQPLPPFGACLLGSLNLVKYVKTDKNKKRSFNWRQLIEDMPIIIRAMDNVTDVAIFPLAEQKEEALSKRRMGIGVTGLANTIEALGKPYGTKPAVQLTEMILNTICESAYMASALLAKEKGSFPLFNKEKYLAGKFLQTRSSLVRDMIKSHGIRNSHLTSIAPTGTISLAADNVSSGIEPVFSYSYTRDIRDFDGVRTEKVLDYGYRVFKTKGKVAIKCTAQDHLNMLIAASKHVDSAVSKTCNINPKMAWEDFKDIYIKAWKGGAKGCTTFNPAGKRYGILNVGDAGDACYVDLKTGKKTCD